MGKGRSKKCEVWVEQAGTSMFGADQRAWALGACHVVFFCLKSTISCLHPSPCPICARQVLGFEAGEAGRMAAGGLPPALRQPLPPGPGGAQGGGRRGLSSVEGGDGEDAAERQEAKRRALGATVCCDYLHLIPCALLSKVYFVLDPVYNCVTFFRDYSRRTRVPRDPSGHSYVL